MQREETKAKIQSYMSGARRRRKRGRYDSQCVIYQRIKRLNWTLLYFNSCSLLFELIL